MQIFLWMCQQCECVYILVFQNIGKQFGIALLNKSRNQFCVPLYKAKVYYPIMFPAEI